MAKAKKKSKSKSKAKARPRKKKVAPTAWGKVVAFNLGLLMVLFFGVEVFMRSKGYRPWKPYRPNVVKVEPVHRMYEAHPRLGYVNIPGEHRIQLESGLVWRSTILPNGRRTTRLPGQEPRGPEVWLMGCSETYGWSVNDEQTFPWMVQAQMPNVSISNFGTPGYGNLQSMYQYELATQGGAIPKVAVVFFASFHTWRNVFAARIRREVSVWNKLGPVQIPYALLAEDGSLEEHQAPPVYFPLPGTTSLAVMNVLDWARVQAMEKGIQPNRVTLEIFRRFHALTQAKGSRLVVAGLNDSAKTDFVLDTLSREGISTLKIGMNLMKKEYMNLPHDRHRNPRANQIIAGQVVEGLRSFGSL